MSDDVTFSEVIRLETRRCYECGRWWAYERYASDSAECPVCARRRVAKALKQIEELSRSNASLRGALTRVKGVR